MKLFYNAVFRIGKQLMAHVADIAVYVYLQTDFFSYTWYRNVVVKDIW